MKTTIALLLSLLVATSAFTNSPIGKSLPRLGITTTTETPHLSDTTSTTVVVAPNTCPRNQDAVVLNNMLRSYANWNDVWDGDYGYGMYGGMGGGYGPYRGGYRRGGYGGYGGYGSTTTGGGLALRRDIPSRDVSSSPVLSGSDVWRDDWSFPMTYYNRGYGSGRRYGRGGYGMGYGDYGMMGYGGGYGGYGMGGYGGYGMGGYGGYGYGGYGGGYGGYGRGYGGRSGGYGLGYSNMNNFPETREWRARRRYSRDYYPNYGYGGYGGYGGYYGRGGYY